MTDGKDRERDRNAAQDRKRKREDAETRAQESRRALTRDERRQAMAARRLSARTVYSVILAEGEEELSRPVHSLLWSGLAAGIGITASVLAEGLLRHELQGVPRAALIENLGYSVGFLLVILSRLQLFTENTLSVVLPVLFRPGRHNLYCTARLWSVVLLANLLGTAIVAAMTLLPGIVTTGALQGMLSISEDYAEIAGLEALLRGIPAGFFIAAIVWMLPSAHGFEAIVIVIFTYLIAVGHFTHVIAGSAEIFLLMAHRGLDAGSAAFDYILPTLLGNILGGTGLFALLAHAQVSEEI